MSNLDNKHPSYLNYFTDWVSANDVYKGSSHVKACGVKYLPASAGMILDGMNSGGVGRKAYDAYLSRSHFPGGFRSSIENALGIMHKKPATFELPERMEPLKKKITLSGEGLDQLLMNINEHQLRKGRLGLLIDAPVNGGNDPYIVIYEAEDIINWDVGGRKDDNSSNLNMVVLNEDENVRKNIFDWDMQTRRRVLMLGDPQLNEVEGSANYSAGLFVDDLNFSASSMEELSLQGIKMTEIPFTFINSRDLEPMPDTPPLSSLIDIVLAIYRTEADYRQSLYMQGQDTLVTMGYTSEDPDVRVGAGSWLNLPLTGDAKYIGINTEGISEVSRALDRLYEQMDSKSAELLNTADGSAESGHALNIRTASRTASLLQIAKVGAYGLERSLKQTAMWMGEDPEQVKVTPYTDFTHTGMLGADLREMMTAKALGAPLSLETIHNTMKDKGMTDKEFEDEMDRISEEEPGLFSRNPDLDDNEDDPNDNQQ